MGAHNATIKKQVGTSPGGGAYRITDDDTTAGTKANPTTGTISAETYQFGPFMQTKLTFNGVAVAVTDANAYGSQIAFTYPEGRVLVLGSVASLQWAVSTTRSSTINDSASLTWGLGTAAASSATLATTMVDHIPKTTKVLSAATTAYNTASTAALAAAAQFDGTATAKSVYLNTGFETGTDIDADGTLLVSGYAVITWVNLGDY